MSEITLGTAVAHVHNRETRKGRVRRNPRHGKASVYWVRLGRASSVRLDLLVAIPDAELVSFFDQQERLCRNAWAQIMSDGDRPAYAAISPPVEQPTHIQRFIRAGRKRWRS